MVDSYKILNEAIGSLTMSGNIVNYHKNKKEADHHKKKIKEFYMNIYINHLKKCNMIKSECSLCLIFNTISIENENDFISKLYKELYDNYTNTINYSNNKFNWQIECIEFIYKMLFIKENYFLFSYNIATYHNKLTKINKQSVLNANILTYYKQRISNLTLSIEKVNAINSIEEQSTIINEILNELYESIFIKVLNPYNLVTSSLALNSKWKKIYQIINSPENKNQYHPLIIKFILEKMFNKKLKHGGQLFDITNYEDTLQEWFERSDHLSLVLDLSSQIMTILSSGKEFIGYKGKNFQEIFIKNYEEFALMKFKQSMRTISHNNNNHYNINDKKEVGYQIFQFPIKDISNSDYMNLIVMRYIVLPTIDLKTSIIICQYRIKKCHMIITRLNKKMHNEVLVNYSFTLRKDIIFPMGLMKQLKANKYDIEVEYLFKSNSEKQNSIVFNFYNYCDKVSELLQYVSPYIENNEEATAKNKEEIATCLKDLKEKKSKAKAKEMKLRTKIEYDIEKYDYKLIVYSFEKDSDTSMLYDNNNKINNDNDNDDYDSINFSSQLNLNQSMFSTNLTANSSNANHTSIFDHSTSSILNRSTSSSVIRLNIKFTEEYIKKKKQSRNFRLFTFFILSFNILLIILTLLFLIIQIDKNNQFTSMLNFFILWSKVMQLFFNSSLNIFFNICTGMFNETKCQNYFADYEKAFVKEHDLPIDFSIQSYIFNELTIKSDSFSEFIYELSSQIYDLNEEEIITIANSDFKFRYLSIVDKHLEIKEEIYKFINALNVYLNLISMIMENDDYATKPIYILNIYGSSIDQIKLDNINLEAPLTQGQITGYNIILNFPIYISTFFTFNKVIYNLLQRNIQDCKSVVISFSMIIMSIHVILMFLCFWFSIFFKMILDLQIKEINSKMEDNAFKIKLKEKITLLRRIALFNKEDPTVIFNIFTAMNNDKIKSQKEKAKENKLHQSNSPIIPTISTIDDISIFKRISMKRKTFYHNASYQFLLNSSYNLLYGIFGAYFIYSITFLLLLLYFLSNFSLLISIFSQNTTLDSYLMSLTGLLQVTAMTNQTEEEMANYLNQTVIDMSNGFSQIMTLESYDALFSIQQESTKDFIPKVNNMNCLTFYDEIKDDIIIKVNEKYQAYDYSIILPKICDSYAFMELYDPNVVITEIIYRLTQLLKTITYTYEGLYELNNSYEMFDLYIILVIIFRPIRFYEAITLFLEAINDLSMKNNAITYIYLTCNIVIELLLFATIREYVIKKYNLINKSMNRMIHSMVL